MTDLPVLPDINFVETDAQAVIDQIIAGYQDAAGITLAPGDPRRLFLLSLAYIIVNQRNLIDAAGKNNLLYYARDEYLDHIGALRQAERLPASPAVGLQRFTLSEAQPGPVGIPQGTRVTSDGDLFFETTEPGTIAAGDLSADINIRCLTPGAAANGLAPGVISALVDPIPFVASVSNLTTTQGGADAESNDDYRQRIYNAPAAFSIAGPEQAYEFWSYTASSAIIDVLATTPAPGEVEVFVLLEGGEIPGQPVLDAVEAVLTPATIRPMTDLVYASAPEPESYNIDFTYYIRAQDSGSSAFIIERVNQAVADYIAWQRSKIGRDINPDELISRVRAAGAKRLDISEPAFTALTTEIAQEDSVTFVYGGIEDE